MKIVKYLPLVVALTVVALFVYGLPAQAAEVPHHWHIKVLPRHAGEPGIQSDVTPGGPPVGLYGIGQAFVQTPLGQPANTAGSELWPCFGGEGAAQPDCAFIGSNGSTDSPSLPGSAVLGSPAYVWYLAVNTADAPTQPFGCDASTTDDATNFCGQTNTWYEDWSGNSTDELTYLIEATQHSSVVADSGTIDFGPNFTGGLPEQVIISGDQNFGTQGVATGPNNGNCEAAFNYPIAGVNFSFITSISATGSGASAVSTATLTAGNTAAITVGDAWYVTGTSNASYNGSVAVVTAVTLNSFSWKPGSNLGTATGGQAISAASAVGGSAYPIIVPAKKTCVDPVASSSITGAITVQEVKLSATTEIAAPTYTRETSVTTCAPAGGQPCYEIKYTKVVSVAQSWYIWMR